MTKESLAAAREEAARAAEQSGYLALMVTWFEGRESPAKFEALTRYV